MIVGENARDNDLAVNPTKEKKLTNIRAAGSDENIYLKPPRQFSLEAALEYIEDDELVEVTPKNIRLERSASAKPTAAKTAAEGRNFLRQMASPVASAVLIVFAGGSRTTAGREGRITIGASCPYLNMVSGALGFGIGGRPGSPGARPRWGS
jgi:hypothetical protein